MSRLTKKNMFIELITEFNEQKTPEAKFAYLCDKLECDLQAKKYSDEGRMSFEGVAPQIINNKTVQKIINSGAETVADVFIEYDKTKYEDSPVFKEILELLKICNAG